MASEYAFSCGNSKYYVVPEYGRLVVQRQDWLGRTFIGYAADIAQALALIKSDARSSRLIELVFASPGRLAASAPAGEAGTHGFAPKSLTQNDTCIFRLLRDGGPEG